MTKISGFIITKNEADRIATAINSIKNIVDEVIVVDSGSTDDTVKIAEDLGAIVVVNPWNGYLAQKTFAENLCEHKWILNIDADEELSKALQDEIEFIFASDIQEKYHAYKINIVILHRRDTKPRAFAPANSCIRLYNREFCSFANNNNTSTHDSVAFRSNCTDIEIYELHNNALHRSATSVTQLIEKANFYSSQQAQDMILLKRYPSNIRIGFEMIISFLKAYFVRRYFIFGFDGFVDSVIFAFARFARLAKARELGKQHQNK